MNFQSSGISDFFSKRSRTNQIVSWAGDWAQLNQSSGAPAVVAQLSSTYNYTPLIELQFFTQSDGRLLRQLNNSTDADYVQSAVSFTSKYKPKYLGIGIEVNILYEKNLSDFNKFVALFNQTYDAVKAVSPSTKVFTIFQFEKMVGLGGGLFGNSTQTGNEWFLLDKFQKADIVGFTTYPGLVYSSPSSIPAGYYSVIENYTSKPIAFTEIGWQSGSVSPQWQSSEADQASFVGRFFNLTDGTNKQMEIWSFLYDPSAAAPFNSMGLYYDNGTAKQAWSAWVNGK